jgi:hypothetical protein
MAVDYVNYNYVGIVDVSDLKHKVKSLDESYWKAYTKRQEMYDAHRYTESLPLMWDIENVDTLEVSEKHPLFYELEIQKFLDKIEPLYRQKYGDGYFNRVILVKLLANHDITPHADTGRGLVIPRRTHIALITNPEVFFIVGYPEMEEKNMKEGEIWEIDNSKGHSVENLSDEDRVHFIIDYVVTKNGRRKTTHTKNN